ncbi:MAG: cupin domain-containing protein [Burkholderiales bacterium]
MDELLGGLSPRAFLRRHWQKRPLLVRGAIPGGLEAASRAALEALAARDSVESRVVQRKARRWQVAHGPFPRAALARLPQRDWSLLVQGVNHHLPAAEGLLRRFSFIPQARLDDVMASYAAPGGGVGPHWDSYDVFLLQASGRRVWNICRPRAFEAIPGQPLRLIAGFVAEDEYLLEPGDMLYLPPGWGHDGIALDDSVTCSVGFRAPSGAELGAAFLDFLADRGLPDAAWRDPGMRPSAHPARIDADFLRQARAMIGRVRWSRRDIDAFLGTWLTTPKPQVTFERRERVPGAAAFARSLAASAVVLDPRSLMLYRGSRIYLNGESLEPEGALGAALRELADARRAPGRRFRGAHAAALLRDWYRSGFLHLE